MKKENVQFYEAPEVESIEIKLEQSINDSSCSAYQEGSCITEEEQQCPENWAE